MSICYDCHWGWTKPVLVVYHWAWVQLEGNLSVLEGGPSHIVWEDENWADHNIDFCLDLIENKRDEYDRFSDYEIDVCKRSLELLKQIPENIRDPEPEEYDGENPGKFPPPEYLECEHYWKRMYENKRIVT